MDVDTGNPEIFDGKRELNFLNSAGETMQNTTSLRQSLLTAEIPGVLTAHPGFLKKSMYGINYK